MMVSPVKDEIEPKLHGPVNRRHALRHGDGAVCQIADPQYRCSEAGGTQLSLFQSHTLLLEHTQAGEAKTASAV
jgi:hypothetical protein